MCNLPKVVTLCETSSVYWPYAIFQTKEASVSTGSMSEPGKNVRKPGKNEHLFHPFML